MAAKKKKALENPFVYEGYESPEYFCDRTEETEKLLDYLKNGVNITLVSPRKIGKTGLILHAFHHIRQQNPNAICLYLDIFSTKNQNDFVKMLGDAVVADVMGRQKSLLKKVTERISWLKPTITIDPLTGQPSFSVGVDYKESDLTIRNIFEYLNSSKSEVYVAIDEFQTIADYPEKGTEALLRSYIQFIHNVHFIFSGSRQHLMYEIFGSAKRPFYQSTSMMSLSPLHEDIYFDFAQRHFAAHNGELSREVFHSVYERFDGWTWYVQSVLNRMFMNSRKATTPQQATDAILSILADKKAQYESFVMLLSDNQLRLLKAIAREGSVVQPTGNEFLRRNHLPGASSTKAALNFLLDHELVYRKPEGEYIVYDRFMALWLQRLFGNIN